MKSYEELLDNLYTQLPEKLKEKTRFKMPEFRSMIQGKQTIVQNFVDVAEDLRRDPKHLMKFITKETAAPCNIDGKRLIMKGRIRDRVLNDRLEAYAKEYVLCGECGKPDTTLVTQEGVTYLKCEACGGRRPVSLIK
ncbi:MAG: translation initiation factor IF-2 subunit beta [Candidatus Diapherotrites archaeon]|nr:translation initiation factor IF-2 subunit beta [Candidatus Diapherotrites archaeon]